MYIPNNNEASGLGSFSTKMVTFDRYDEHAKTPKFAVSINSTNKEKLENVQCKI